MTTKPALAHLHSMWSAALLRFLPLFTLLLAPASGIAEERTLFSEQGYRIADYRSPLPVEPPAGQRIDTPALDRLLREADPVLIDVLVKSITTRPSPLGPRLKSMLVTPLATPEIGEADVSVALSAAASVVDANSCSPPASVRVTWLPLTVVV